ncbi:hypothetical protein ASF84_05275 [Pseudomonas sp. Leaf127]|uniref:hypothetical protein n=1 Tax=Pseudomonas sp. Leaf127 TaxID=1736267 RepID=UPI000702981A|nr:hypothetical protein [Pseudomonas sp. Leaf127]KQQ60123.1 hypothetical protein ASF84_05275 [Pseudomonas sp. Leaf127]
MSRFLILAACLAVSACVSSGRYVTEEQLAQVESGKTTGADLVRIIGEPTSRTYEADGSQIMAWGYARIGMFFGIGTKVQSTALKLGPDGTVRGYTRAGSGPVKATPLKQAAPVQAPAPAAPIAPATAAPLSKQAYQEAQIEQLMQQNLPYDEYQKRYKAIMGQ